MLDEVKLTVVCFAYNHEMFIREALDSIVSQETDFRYQVLVHDDASTDKTVSIIQAYEEKYPNLIYGIYQTENQWSKGKSLTKNFISPLVKGDYVAFCEGDDFWNDVTKLQRQVDYLDTHPKCSLCFHPVKVFWEGSSKSSTVAPNRRMLKRLGNLNLEKLLRVNFIQTNSVVYRWRFKVGGEEIIPDGILPGDWYLHLLHAECGDIGFIDKEMATYRRHSSGVWTGSKNSKDWFIKNSCACIRCFEAIENHFNVCKLSEKEFYRMAQWYAQEPATTTSIKSSPLFLLYLFLARCLTFGKTSQIYEGWLRAARIYFKYWRGVD